MKAAIACPGPTLADWPGGWWADAGFDLVVGVNRAANLVACDYWVTLDRHTVKMSDPLGEPPVIAAPGMLGNITNAHPEIRVRANVPVDRRWIEGTKVRWWRWGLTVAIGFATSRGADRIELYGVDWRGTDDWDGLNVPKMKRSPGRWARERRVFDRLVGVLAARGVTVVRMTTRDVPVRRPDTAGLVAGAPLSGPAAGFDAPWPGCPGSRARGGAP